MGAQLLAEPEKTSQIEKEAANAGAPVLSFLSKAPLRPMFSQTFVELSAEERKRRRATQAGSLIVQLLVAGLLILLPLWYIDVLPMQALATFLVAPPPPPPPPAPSAPSVKVAKISEVVNGSLRAPSKIPEKIKMLKEEETPPQASGGVIGGVEGGVPGGQVNGVLGSLLATTHTTQAPVAAPPKRLKISTGVSEGLLINRVDPVYPIIAMRARIEGTVQLRAVVSRQGTIENLQLVVGHPLLVPAAMDAVKQWRYRPYVLNGDPVEVETVVIVIFHMH